MSVARHRRDAVSTRERDSSVPRSIFGTPEAEAASAEDFRMVGAETVVKKLIYTDSEK